MEKRFLQILGAGLFLIFVWTIWRPFWRLDLNEAPQPKNDSDVIFQIEKGASTQGIAKALKKEGLIVNKRSFIRVVTKEDLVHSIQFGSYVLSPSMTMREVVTTLTQAGTGEMAVTFIEGWTINDMDSYLADLGLIDAGEFKQCSFNCSFDYDFLPEDSSSLEGYLFPDTYFIDSAAFSVENMIDRMLGNFDQKFTDEMQSDLAASGRSIQEMVIVASMIEKEVFTTNDIPLVSGIIWKRLDNDWTLGIDATLLYNDADGELTASDLTNDTPYNTRLNKGLPPTPISNPGLASLNGAIYPEASDYWFYLTTLDTGEVIYATTNEEHEANKDQYL